MKKAASLLAVIAASVLVLGTASADTFDQSLTLEQAAVKTQAQTLKQRVTQHNAEARESAIEFQHGHGGGHFGGGFGGSRGGDRGWGRGGDHGGWHGGDRGGDRGGWGRGGDRGGWHGGWHPRSGPGRWDRWGHPGWGYRHRWGWRGGRYIWWGWNPWYSGVGMACDVYYADRYTQCSDAAWADNAECQNSCLSAGNPAGCSQQCDFETRNAVDTCEFSYRGYWNCGGPVFWPPVGVVIRIP